MKKPRVLTVDDSIPNLICLENILREMDLEVIKANSGEEALSILLAEEIHCVVSDVKMPSMDGFELTKTISDDPSFSHIPVLLVTGLVFSDNDRLKGYRCGAVDYIQKPLDEEVTGSKVRRFANDCLKIQILRSVEQKLNHLEQLAISPIANTMSNNTTLNKELVKALDYLSSLKTAWDRSNDK